MKVFKVVLALLLGAGVVYAYFNFPNPMEQQAEKLAAEKAAQSAEKSAGTSTEPPQPH